MKKIILLAIAVTSLSTVSFANDDNSREIARDLKASIQSLENQLDAQGIQYEESDITMSNSLAPSQIKALESREDELTEILNTH